MPTLGELNVGATFLSLGRLRHISDYSDCADPQNFWNLLVADSQFEATNTANMSRSSRML